MVLAFSFSKKFSLRYGYAKNNFSCCVMRCFCGSSKKFLSIAMQKQFVPGLNALLWYFAGYVVTSSFNYKFKIVSEFLKKRPFKCKLQAILTIQYCLVILS